MVAIRTVQQPSLSQGIRGGNFARNALSGTDRLPGQPAASVDEARENLIADRLTLVQSQQFNRAIIKQQADISNAQSLLSSANSLQRRIDRTNRSPSRNILQERAGTQSAQRLQPPRTLRSAGPVETGQRGSSRLQRGRTIQAASLRTAQSAKPAGITRQQLSPQRGAIRNLLESAGPKQPASGNRINLLI
jgi:hypothetical protein